MPNGVADLSLQSSIPHVWFVLYRYIVKSPATILNERFDFLFCLFVCSFFKCEKQQQEGSGQEQPTQT